jgi:hypothetical protein
MLDEAIAASVANNKIISTSKKQLCLFGFNRSNSPQLMQSLIQAIAGHVQIIDA